MDGKYLVKSATGQVVHAAWAYPSFHSMDELPVHCRVTPSIKIQRHPFIHLGGEKHCKSIGKLSYPRTQCNDSSQGPNLNSSIRSPARWPSGHHG